jgi:chromate transporter
MDLVRLTWTMLWLSFLCIGGGLGIIPEMERQAVQVHGWLTAREFVDGYTLAQLTPGPNMRVAMVIGYHAHGLPGAALGGLAMFIPAAALTAVLARHWSRVRGRPWALAAERTLAPIGIGLMAGGVYTLARSAIHDGRAAAIAAAAALLLATGRVPPIVVIAAAGLAGLLLIR